MTTALFNDENTVNDLIAFATAHGNESGNDHEIGDLQSLLSKAWSLMTPEMQRDMLCSTEVSELVDSATGHSLLTSIAELEHEEWESVCETYGLDSSFQYTEAQKLDAVNHSRLEVASSSIENVSGAVLTEVSPAQPEPILAKPRRMKP